MRTLLVLAPLAALLPTAVAQKPSPPYDTSVTNLRVDAFVSAGGRILTGLKASDFVLRDNGEPQVLVDFREQSLPLDVVLLWDHRMLGRQDILHFAAEALLPLRPTDRVAVIGFGIDPVIQTPLTSDCTAIAEGLKRAAAREVRFNPTGSSTLAIEYALRHLATRRAPEDRSRRQAILMVSFGRSGGISPDEPAIRRLWETQTVYNALLAMMPVRLSGIFGNPRRLEPTSAEYRIDNPFHIAAETGGYVLVIPTEDPSELFDRIRGGYSFWYRPPEAEPGSRRKITIQLTPQAQARFPGADIHHRTGYLRPEPSPLRNVRAAPCNLLRDHRSGLP